MTDTSKPKRPPALRVRLSREHMTKLARAAAAEQRTEPGWIKALVERELDARDRMDAVEESAAARSGNVYERFIKGAVDPEARERLRKAREERLDEGANLDYDASPDSKMDAAERSGVDWIAKLKKLKKDRGL